MRNYVRASGALFTLISLAQLTRSTMKLPAQVGTFAIPVWFSLVAFAVTGALAIWSLRVSRAAS